MKITKRAQKMIRRFFSPILAVVISLLFVIPSWAADPAINTGTIFYQTNMSNMNVAVNPGGSGCASGQMWDIVVGRCTSPLQLRTVSTSRSCSCSCSGSGYCTSQQSGTYLVFGWRLPPAGSEQVSSTGSTSWGSCVEVTNACVKDPIAPGTGSGTVGEQFYVTIFICNSSNPSYYSGPLSASYKEILIQMYRSFNPVLLRCPDYGGYLNWQNFWVGLANQYQAASPGTSLDDALLATWSTTAATIRQAAAINGEEKPSYQTNLNVFCTDFATSAYGRPINAVYVAGSGDKCLIQ
ncbi:hypothetical protein [Pseudomonas sp. CFBP 13719]|uniref:hypothetical protein n=1 Tax=Pseudomonas sp. CFBP 13719 TaxID=2775303 RepID=UPI00177D9ECC|nr:hypothetical protein [Pseudomonas sp. CFBP 13719]MBD8681261.1 hypothetical protein [Pseudomonas sp. CFBP 13719]